MHILAHSGRVCLGRWRCTCWRQTACPLGQARPWLNLLLRIPWRLRWFWNSSGGPVLFRTDHKIQPSGMHRVTPEQHLALKLTQPPYRMTQLIQNYLNLITILIWTRSFGFDPEPFWSVVELWCVSCCQIMFIVRSLGKGNDLLGQHKNSHRTRGRI